MLPWSVSDEDLQAVADAAHAVVQEAKDAGVWVFGGRKLHHMLKTEGIWPAGQDTQHTHHVTSLGGKTYTTLPEPPPPF